MQGFGTGFIAAKKQWLYDASGAQPIIKAIFLFIAIFALHLVLQLVFAAIIFPLVSDLPFSLVARDLEGQRAIAKATVIGLLPEGVLICLAAVLLSYVGGRGPVQVMALRRPRLGFGGWVAVIAGFVVAMWLTNLIVMTVLGIDPTTYLPTKDGVTDQASSSGLVEKTIADMADEPLHFWTALPAIVFIIPMAEEFIFRGAIFSALLKAGFGRVPTVLLTAATWAVIHAIGAPWVFVLIIAVMGIILGTLLLRFGSLWVTIACHSVWNGITMLGILALVQR